MQSYKEYYFLSADGCSQIHVNCWRPDQVIGVVQIAHGIAEYGKRYEPFARYLCDHGFAVVANDHLGHGLSIAAGQPPLFFSETNGWTHVVDDMEQLRLQTAAEFPGVPYFLFGHSMGSFLSRTYLIRYPGKLSGCILCGTGNPGTMTILGGQKVVAHEIKKVGKTGYSKKADDLAFGSYNRKFAPNRTEADWLSTSEANVDSYLRDPQCGGKISAGLMQDLLEGLWLITRKKNLSSMDLSIPVLFIAGQDDPVGNMGKGVKKAHRNFLSVGVTQADIKLYEGLRHEILNEDAHMDIYFDILSWLRGQACFTERREGVNEA